MFKNKTILITGGTGYFGNAVLSCINLKQAIARTKSSKNRAAEAVNAIISVLNNV